MDACCGPPLLPPRNAKGGHNHDHDHGSFDGRSPAYRRVLWAVIALNAGMFAVEIVAGATAQSTSLWADSLDFAADASTYGLSLWATTQTLRARARVALFKGYSLAVMAAVVLAVAIWRVAIIPDPEPVVMGWVGFAALGANVLSAILLYAWRDGDANVMSVWLCTRNDAIGNLGVMLAAAAVWWTATPWPDLIVAAGMAGLFLVSSARILRRSRLELDHARSVTA